VLCIHDCDFWTLLAQPGSLIFTGDGSKIFSPELPSAFSLNIFYLLKCAKRITHNLNKRMKSSIYNELQHYLIEHACLWIFLTLICVNWIKTEKKRNEREGLVVMVCVVVHLVNNLNDKKPFDLFIYSNTCLKIISFCSFERIWLPLVKSLRSIAQSLGSQLRLWNNIYLIFA